MQSSLAPRRGEEVCLKLKCATMPASPSRRAICLGGSPASNCPPPQPHQIGQPDFHRHGAATGVATVAQSLCGISAVSVRAPVGKVLNDNRFHSTRPRQAKGSDYAPQRFAPVPAAGNKTMCPMITSYQVFLRRHSLAYPGFRERFHAGQIWFAAETHCVVSAGAVSLIVTLVFALRWHQQRHSRVVNRPPAFPLVIQLQRLRELQVALRSSTYEVALWENDNEAQERFAQIAGDKRNHWQR